MCAKGFILSVNRKITHEQSWMNCMKIDFAQTRGIVWAGTNSDKERKRERKKEGEKERKERERKEREREREREKGKKERVVLTMRDFQLARLIWSTKAINRSCCFCDDNSVLCSSFPFHFTHKSLFFFSAVEWKKSDIIVKKEKKKNSSYSFVDILLLFLYLHLLLPIEASKMKSISNCQDCLKSLAAYVCMCVCEREL